MMINPVKKSLPLFNKLPETEDKDTGRAFSEANPFFSWHANHINVERKKVIILVNDRTLLPLIITDVNAERKKQLGEMIEDGIRSLFNTIGIDQNDIDRYFELAGGIEINAVHNRKTLGHINEYLFSFTTINMNETVPLELCLWLGDMVQLKLEHFNSIEETQALFSGGLELHEPDTEVHRIEKTWEPFDQWSSYLEAGWFEEYEEISEEVRKNNDKMLREFGRYLKKQEKQSDKTAERHIMNAEFYLNSYMLHFEIRTVLTETTDSTDFLGNWYVRKALWANEKNLKQTGTALRKLYKFLNEAGEISDEEMKAVRPAITDGIEEGKGYLNMQEPGGMFR